MVQTKRKTNVIALAIILGIVLVFAMAAALFAAPSTETAEAAGTRSLDTITIANMYANRTTGKYGNFSWDPSKLQEITSSSFTISASVASGYQPFYICWTKPAGTAYPSKLNYGYTIGTGVNGDSASKTWTSSFPSDVSFSGIKTYPVGEVSLSGNYDTIYFCMGHGYMYDTLVVTSITFQPKVNTVKVTATAGTGVQSVYLSKNQNATSGSNSGTDFDKGDTVYAFATLAEGYKRPNNNWTLVSGTADTAGAIYRVSSKTMGTSDYNFGTINATAKTKSLTRNTNGGGYMSGITLTYGQTANLTVPTRNGYSFLGWNTNAEGTGTTYGSGSSAVLTVAQVNAIIADNSIDTLFAMWTANEYNVIVDGDDQNLTYGSYFDLTPPTPEEGYTFSGYYDEANGSGKKYTDADGHSVCAWDKAENDTHLYAYFTKDMTVSFVGYEDDYDGEAHTIIVNVTDPEDDYTIMYGETEDSYATEEITKTDAGTYTIYFKVTKIGYNDYYGSAVVKINKIEAVVTAPTAKTGLHYTGVAQELINAGSTTGGTIEYKLGDGDWSTDIPTAVNVDDDYIVSYRLVGGTNYNDVAGVALSEAIVIEANDKTLLTATISDAENYRDSISEGFGTIADYLDEDILAAKSVESNDNKTVEQIQSAVEALLDAIGNAQIDVVEAKIAGIGAVTLDKEDEIEAVFEAYAELSDDQKASVNNYDDLVAALIELVEMLIDEIPDPVVYTTDCADKIEKAKEIFYDLSEDRQALVSNEQILLDAIAEYEKLTKANAVKDLIAAIDDPVVYPTSGAGIKAASDAYDALTDEEKALVDNSRVLFDAEEEYERQKNAGADYVEGLIDAIGTVELTVNSKAAIDLAREEYEALTTEQKALVENYDVLVAAEAAYKALYDQDKANAAKALIEAIGMVEFTEGSKDKIDAAKEAYDALTDEQKALIAADVPTMTTAESTYETLRTNYFAAQEVIELINSIGTVEYTEESKARIDAAMEAYNNLSDDQKALVENHTELPTAETIYIGLDNQKKAQDVRTLIAAIGKVTYPDSKEAIDAAREGYDALTDEQKELVDNYDDLTAAEEFFAEREAREARKLPAGVMAGLAGGTLAFFILIAFLLCLPFFRKKD